MTKYFKNEKNSNFTLLIFSLLYFIGVGIIFGFTYESNDDSAFENMLRGLYWNTPISNFYFFQRGISYFFIFLYQYLDLGINWYGLVLISLNFLSFYILLLVIKKGGINNFIIALVFLIFLQNVYLVSFTRVSLFLAISGLLLFNDFYRGNKSKVFYTIPILIFIVAYCIRPNAAILGMILTLPFILITNNKRKLILAASYIFVIVLSSIIGDIIIKNVQDPDYTKQLSEAAKIFIPIVDYEYKPESVDADGLDNIFFEIKNVFYFDKRTTTFESIKRLSDDSFFISQEATANKLVKLAEMIFHKPFFVFCIIFCIGLAFYEKKYIYPVFFGIVYFFGVLIALTVLKKMEYRILIPIMTIMLVFLLMVLRDSIKNIFSKNALFYKVAVFSFVFIFLFQAKLYLDRISQLNDQRLKSSALTIEDLPDKKIFLISDPFLNFKPLKYQTNISRAILIPMFGWSAYNEVSYNFQLREFGTNEISEIFKSISGSKDYLFLGTVQDIFIFERILDMNGIDGKFNMQQNLGEGVIFLYSFKMN